MCFKIFSSTQISQLFPKYTKIKYLIASRKQNNTKIMGILILRLIQGNVEDTFAQIVSNSINLRRKKCKIIISIKMTKWNPNKTYVHKIKREKVGLQRSLWDLWLSALSVNVYVTVKDALLLKHLIVLLHIIKLTEETSWNRFFLK